MPSAEVARLGYDGWKTNQRVVVTGTRNAILATLVPLLPRRAVSFVHRLQGSA